MSQAMWRQCRCVINILWHTEKIKIGKWGFVESSSPLIKMFRFPTLSSGKDRRSEFFRLFLRPSGDVPLGQKSAPSSSAHIVCKQANFNEIGSIPLGGPQSFTSWRYHQGPPSGFSFVCDTSCNEVKRSTTPSNPNIWFNGTSSSEHMPCLT